jgi:hypothetical protein
MRKTQDSVKLGAALRELAAVGCIVDLSVAEVSEENEVEIHQVGGVHESTLFDLPNGGAGYIFEVEIINQTSKAIYCSGIPELRMPWEDSLFSWLPDPRETPRRTSYYRIKPNGRRERIDAVSESYSFPGGAQLEYPRALVLNHRLANGVLAPGRPLRGLLLASGNRMPSGLLHGQWLEPTFSITSSRHVEYTAKVQLWIDRLQAKAKPARKHHLRGEPVGPVGPVGSTVAVPGPGVAYDPGTLLIRSGAVHSVGAGTTDPCERVNNK